MLGVEVSRWNDGTAVGRLVDAPLGANVGIAVTRLDSSDGAAVG